MEQRVLKVLALQLHEESMVVPKTVCPPALLLSLQPQCETLPVPHPPSNNVYPDPTPLQTLLIFPGPNPGPSITGKPRFPYGSNSKGPAQCPWQLLVRFLVRLRAQRYSFDSAIRCPFSFPIETF